MLEDSGDLAAAVASWRRAEAYYRQMSAAAQADRLAAMIADRERRLGGSEQTGHHAQSG